MYFLYGLANGNAREAARLYAKRYPNIVKRNRDVFVTIHYNLGEHGTLGRNLDVPGGPMTRGAVEFEEAVLHHIDQNPSNSTRAIAHQMGGSNRTVWEVLNGEGLSPFHIQKVQGLTPGDYDLRLQACHWLLQHCEELTNFPSLILYTEECCFTRDGYLMCTIVTFGVYTIPTQRTLTAINTSSQLILGLANRYVIIDYRVTDLIEIA